MKIDLNKIDELLNNSNLSEVAKAVGIPYRTLQAWKRGENKWWVDTQDKLTKLQNHINMEELKMKKDKLTVNNLYFSHYEDGLHILEFEVDGKKVFVKNIDADVDGDEDYWDDEENVKKAVDEADEEDIEIV